MTSRARDDSAPGVAAWDEIADVVVVGTGAAGLTAATLAHDGGCSVVLIDKAAEVGGTTAVSGGVMWLPGNPHMAEAGLTDTRDDAIDYINGLRAGLDDHGELVEVFVDTAGEALTYLEANTPLRTSVVSGLADYFFHFGAPGSVAAGRSVEPLPYPVGTELPQWSARLATRGTLLSLGAVTTLAEDISRTAPAAELDRRTALDVRTKGAALVAMLLKGLVERGITPLLGTAATSLVESEGTVIGVRAMHQGRATRIGARRGVVLACGGYEWNEQMVRGLIGGDVQPLTPANNVGDGLIMAMQAGGQLATRRSFWGQPAMFDPTVLRDGRPVPQFEWGRGASSSLIVSRDAIRFANEALPYHDFSKAFRLIADSRQAFPNDPPAWMVFDQRVKSSMQIMSVAADDRAPDWMHASDTIGQLATTIGLNVATLVGTVDRFDEHARSGHDPDFGRHLAGMTGAGRVRPLDQPPFYALPIYVGTIGTNGGPRTDPDGRVVRAGGGVVEGLYAVGNSAAAPLGDHYPGAGGTLGPAVVFGYRAGRHVAAHPGRSLTACRG